MFFKTLLSNIPTWWARPLSTQVPDFLYCDYFEQYGMLHNLTSHTYNSPRVITDSWNDRMTSEQWIGKDFETRCFGLI